MPTNWMNNDGLYIKFGTNEATPAQAGEYRFDGPERCIELELTLALLTPITTNYFPSDTVVVPSGSRITRCELFVETAATSAGSPTLDIGLIRLDRTTGFDDDGFIAAVAMTALDTAGTNILYTPTADSVPAGGTGFGALIGTTLANPGYIVASTNTAVFTAGKVIFRVFYYKP